MSSISNEADVRSITASLHYTRHMSEAAHSSDMNKDISRFSADVADVFRFQRIQNIKQGLGVISHIRKLPSTLYWSGVYLKRPDAILARRQKLDEPVIEAKDTERRVNMAIRVE